MQAAVMCSRAIVPLQPAAQRRSASRAVRCMAQQPLIGDQPTTSGDDELRREEERLEVEREQTQRHFASSLATLGLGATLLSERLNGVGVVRQLELSFAGMDGVLVFTIASLVLAGLKPSKKLAGAPPEDPIESVQTIAGRLSFLGLAGTLAAELVTGKGLLSLLNIDTGVELSEAEGIFAFLLMLILTGPSKHTNPRT